ncbi:MAG: acyltransferase family protein [Janthinobacterium lividum]
MRRTTLTYRSDIDGLRAISVALVFAFHLGLIGGGFIGVDVFFVISGCLITGIIHAELEGGRFTFKEFYERRARRILPALLTMIVATAAGGYILLYPGDYETFGRSSLYALAGLSNIFFMTHTGYFDLPSQNMPLLHTWSLGVEEQFYVLWPAVLMIGYRIFGGSKLAWRSFLGAIVAASFVAAFLEVSRDPKAAFYLPFTRGWELALGGLLVFLPRVSGRIAVALPPLGLTLIAATAIILKPSDPFPGLNALPPVIGALLILCSGQTIVGGLLGRLAPIGRISYSLYLWHWPIIVFWRVYLNGAPLAGLDMLVIVGLATGVSVLSYAFIEQPLRRIRLRPVLLLALTAEIAVAAIIVPIVRTTGFPGRIPASAQALGSSDLMWTWQCPESKDVGLLGWPSIVQTAPSCIAGSSWEHARHHALVWGDSNAEAIFPLLGLAASRQDTSIILVNPCPAIIHQGITQRYWPEEPKYNEYCETNRNSVLKYLDNGSVPIDMIIVASSWTNTIHVLVRHASDRPDESKHLNVLQDGFDSLIPLIKYHRKIVLFGDVPKWGIGYPVPCVLAQIALPRRACTTDVSSIPMTLFNQMEKPSHDILRSAAAKAGVTSYSPEDYLCDTDRCLTKVNGDFIYRDGDHLRRNLSLETSNKLVELMNLESLFKDLDDHPLPSKASDPVAH